MKAIRVRAPATTANLGPAFDCAAVALDLWNELELREGEPDGDPAHLGVRAFAGLASPEGWRFHFTDRIPRASGLGSSAAVIALGLVAGAAISGTKQDPESLLAEGVELEGHPDNLAAALAGGVCLTWEGRIGQIAQKLPAVPIAVIPQSTVETAAARARLPKTVPFADAAHTASRAVLLGAGLATGSPNLFAAALDDRLHEPYRSETAPLLQRIRGELPPGALGATLSGSGPTVIVWAAHAHAGSCAQVLGERFTEAETRILDVSPAGAGLI